MALNEVGYTYSGSLVDPSFWHPTPPANQYDINNTKWFLNSNGGGPGWSSLINDENGYAYTWLGSGSSDGTTIKATAKDPGTGKPVFPAFYYAAHYNEELTAQGITLAPNVGAGKWFLPTFAQFYKAYVNLAFADNLPISLPFGTSGSEGTISNMDKNMIDQAISQVNGYPLNSSYMATSSVVDTYSGIGFVTFYTTNTWITTGGPIINGGVRPFITY